jgi:hypothetical protein
MMTAHERIPLGASEPTSLDSAQRGIRRGVLENRGDLCIDEFALVQ